MLKFLRSIVASALLLGSGPAIAQESLRLAFLPSDNDLHWVKYLKTWIDTVNKDPAGLIRIDAYPNGALGRALPQQAQMVLDGVADIAFVVPSISSGRFPDDALFELPGYIRSIEEGTRLYQKLADGGHLRGYDDYVVLGSFMNANSHIYSRKPIMGLADLRGLRTRMIGAVGAQTAKELGLVPIQMSPVEVVEALGRGTIDATATVPQALVEFGIDRVTSHDYMLPLNSNTFALLMSKARFQALPKEAQDVLQKYSGAWLNELYARQMGTANQELSDRLKADGKREVVDPGQDDLTAAAEIYQRVISNWVAADPANAKLYEVANGVLADIRR